MIAIFFSFLVRDCIQFVAYVYVYRDLKKKKGIQLVPTHFLIESPYG